MTATTYGQPARRRSLLGVLASDVSLIRQRFTRAKNGAKVAAGQGFLAAGALGCGVGAGWVHGVTWGLLSTMGALVLLEHYRSAA